MAAKKTPRYPTMKTRTIKCRHNPDLYVDATVSLDTGRPVVAIDSEAPLVDDIVLTPAEADRLAAALAKAAGVARAKSAHGKHSDAVRQQRKTAKGAARRTA